jgi:hypothetical protein
VGSAALVVIHADPRIGWQRERAPLIAKGLSALGINWQITSDQTRGDGLAILLGTTRWRQLEVGDYLLVDRCSFGETNQYVSLVRNGHGRRGDHRVPENVTGERWATHGVPVASWRTGRRVVLCGQHESYSPTYPDLRAWYGLVKPHATHFRQHPQADNPTGLPATREWSQVGKAITLNSSVGVDAVLNGIPTVTMDDGAMAWDVTSHVPHETSTPDRTEWLHWLAWTQWSWNEIAEGTPWAHLLP